MGPRTAREITISLASGNTPIQIDAGWLAQVGNRLRTIFARASKTFLITDQQVAAHYGAVVEQSLREEGVSLASLAVPAGEHSKSIAEATRIWEFLLARGADRKSLVLALGGGVVGDLAGFVAATYARGIPYLQIPTSLVAQVDSSIGGKVGINLPTAKNMVGCFWHPTLVAIDVRLLQTLPPREFASGLAEVVKYGMGLDVDLFEFLERHVQAIHQRDEATLIDIVERCVAIKARIVMEDERDVLGRRAILNYGHTFAHAIETCSGYGEWLHGEAVAIGMHSAARLAQRLGWIGQGVVDRQAALLQALNLPLTIAAADPSPYVQAMLRDKKTERSAIRCVLPSAVGEARLSDPIEPAVLLAIWNHA